MSVPTVTATLPKAPAPLVATSELLPDATVTTIKAEFVADEAIRQRMYAKAKELGTHGEHANHGLQVGDFATSETAIAAGDVIADELLTEVEAAKNGWYLRGNPAVGSAFEKMVSCKCMSAFFKTGTLAPRSSFARFTNEEYICGVIHFCQELGRYAVGRATVGDASSVVLCRDLVQQVFGQLLEFDFRNGPLRRKYDGVKYVLRRLEDVLYELSLIGAYVAPPEIKSEQPAKRAKIESSSDGGGAAAAAGGGGAAAAEDGAAAGAGTAGAGAGAEAVAVNAAEFAAMRETMSAYDKKREDVIKGTRDLQKLSKQAIFSLHRSDFKKASTQLAQVVAKSREIFDGYIKDEPALRQGSYANAMEEFAEAVLFKVWLEDKTICALDGPALEGLIDSTDYIGGLADFTGEVGRFAVAAAARRDDGAVRECLAADLSVQDALMKLGLPGKLGKKESMLKTNVKKLEHVLYELSLIKASGRKTSSAAKTEESSGDGE